MAGRRLRLLLTAAAVLSCARGGSQCLLYQTSHWGWGSNVFGLLMTLAGNANDSTVILDESAWAYKCSDGGSWREYFVGEVPMTLAEMPDVDTCEPVRYEGCPLCGHDLLASRPVHEAFPLMVHALRRVWQLSDSMQLHADIQVRCPFCAWCLHYATAQVADGHCLCCALHHALLCCAACQI